MKKLLYTLKINKKILMFMIVLVIIGILTGSFLTVILNSNDKILIINKIKSFTNDISTGTYNWLLSLKNILISNIIIIIIIWILGISIIGFIITFLIIFWKSFILGLILSSLVLTFNLKGVFIGLLYIFPALIINLLIILYLSSHSFQVSIHILKSIINKKQLNLSLFIKEYLKILGLSIIFIIICSLYEIFVTPILLKQLILLLF